ncbi:hypothetical protein BS17DRAFT_815566 [Gyrodon lividus]|nr:hypothetical protein BS17DRAFT_815566 [Gyrodon lividus]
MSSSSPPPTSTSTSISSSPTNTPSSPSSPTITSANYFFGFIVTFVVLLLLFVGCGVGSRRRFAFVGTVWDEGLLDMDEGAPGGRETGRRRRRLSETSAAKLHRREIGRVYRSVLELIRREGADISLFYKTSLAACVWGAIKKWASVTWHLELTDVAYGTKLLSIPSPSLTH